MRITNLMRSWNVLYNLERRSENMSEYQKQMVTGRRINQPSDDPQGTNLDLTYRRRLACNEQFQRNIDDGLLYMSFTDDNLNSINTILTEARTLAVQGDNANLNAADRLVLANEVNIQLEELVSKANASFGGKYIYGGYNSQTQPFTVERDEDGSIISVTANPDGIDDEIQREIGMNMRGAINIGGEALFQPDGADETTDMFRMLITLREALCANNTGAIGPQIDALDEGIENMNYHRSTLGQRVDYFNRRMEQLQTLEVTLEDGLSEIEDVDFTEAVMNYELEKAAYTAALATGAQIIQMGLLNFIG